MVVEAQQAAHERIVAQVRAEQEDDLRDLDQGHYYWDSRPMEHFEEWCQDLEIMDTSAEALGPIPSTLQPWQRFFVGSLLNWTISGPDHLHRVKGTRRFRQGILFTGKGAGKSTLIAFLAGWMLTSDGYYRGEQFIQAKGFRGYLMGETRAQVVETCFSVLTNALMDSGFAAGGQTDLSLAIMGGKFPVSLHYKPSRGTLEALGTSGTGRGKAGLRPDLVIAEEVGAWANSVQLDKLTNGFKNALQPLLLVMSNPGRKRTGVGWKFREKAREASLQPSHRGDLDHVFGLLFENDPSDFRSGKQWWPVKRNWAKSNPTLGTTIRDDYLLAKIKDAGERPFERESVKQLQFGAWTAEGGPLFTSQDWLAAQVPKVTPPEGAECFMGIDLGASRDMTGVACVWEAGDKVLARVTHYAQGSSLKDREITTSQPFSKWVADGAVIVAGDRDIDLAPIRQEFMRLRDRHPNLLVAGDGYHRARLVDTLGVVPEKDAVTGDIVLYDHPQGYQSPRGPGLWMHGSIEALIRLVDSGRLQLEANPCTDWNLNCASVPTRADGRLNLVNTFPRARRGPSGGQIDGLMALVMAVGLWAAKPKPKPNILAAYASGTHRF